MKRLEMIIILQEILWLQSILKDKRIFEERRLGTNRLDSSCYNINPYQLKGMLFYKFIIKNSILYLSIGLLFFLGSCGGTKYAKCLPRTHILHIKASAMWKAL
jgi:hypothetical protein